MFAQKLPEENDILGLRYDFTGLPEINQANPTPPVYQLEDLLAKGKKALKHEPPVWVTEYGFEATKASACPSRSIRRR